MACLHGSHCGLPRDADAYYPTSDVQVDVAALCLLFPETSGCSILRLCGQGAASGAACEPFSLLADLCAGLEGDTVSNSTHCKAWKALCGVSTSVVDQCTSRPALRGLVGSSAAHAAVVALCRAMPDMQECAECRATDPDTIDCKDPLHSYSSVCRAMQMDGCEAWARMCTPPPQGLAPLCGGPEETTCSGVMQVFSRGAWVDGCRRVCAYVNSACDVFVLIASDCSVQCSWASDCKSLRCISTRDWKTMSCSRGGCHARLGVMP